MKRANGVYVIGLDIFIPTSTASAAMKLAVKIAAETGMTDLIFG